MAAFLRITGCLLYNVIDMHPTEMKFIFCRLRHRGPDWSGLHCHQDCYLAHQRLAIIDPTSGDQPLYNEDKTVVVTVCIWIRNAITVSTHFFMVTAEFTTKLFNCCAFGNCHLFSKVHHAHK